MWLGAYCEGNYGCYDTTIETDSDIYCSGDGGCSDSVLDCDGSAMCTGAYGCIDTTITSVEDTYKITFLLWLHA